jgi:hypothetical protein
MGIGMPIIPMPIGMFIPGIIPMLCIGIGPMFIGIAGIMVKTSMREFRSCATTLAARGGARESDGARRGQVTVVVCAAIVPA